MSGKRKNDHFRAMLEQAKEEMDSELGYVLFDSWYISLDNLKAIRSSSAYTVGFFIYPHYKIAKSWGHREVVPRPAAEATGVICPR